MLALASIVTLSDGSSVFWVGTLAEFLADNADGLDLSASEIRAALARDGAVQLGGGAMPVFTLDALARALS